MGIKGEQWDINTRLGASMLSSCSLCPNDIPEAHWQTLVADVAESSGPPTKGGYDLFCRFYNLSGTERELWRKSLSIEDHNLLLDFIEGARHSCSGRPYVSTKKRRLGLAPPGVQEGDVICIFYGANVPYVVRFGRSGVGKLIGDAYVNGIMYGEALTIDDRGDDEMIRIS